MPLTPDQSTNPDKGAPLARLFFIHQGNGIPFLARMTIPAIAMT
jgi:hypothetical protein